MVEIVFGVDGIVLKIIYCLDGIMLEMVCGVERGRIGDCLR